MMKVKYSVFQFNLTIALLIIATVSFAQNEPVDKKPDPTGTIAEEIDVERPYRPILAEAAKIRRSPDLDDIKLYKPQLTYDILDKRQELNTEIHQLYAQEILNKPEVALKNNYVKIGAGNMNGGLGELYVNTGKDEALQAGFFLKHLMQEGSINKQKFSTQKASLFGKSILDDVILNGNIDYDRLSTYFYAFDPANPTVNSDPSRQRFDLINLEGEIINNYREDNVGYGLKGNAYLLSNISTTRERSFALSGFASKGWNHFNLGLNASVDFTKNKDAAYKINNNIARLNPYIRVQGAGYKLMLGVNFVQEFGAMAATNLLPSVSAEVDVVPRYATIYGGVTGDVSKMTIRELSQQNPFLNTNLSIKNSLEKMNVYAGIKGNAGAGFGYKATAFYKTVTNLPFFVNNMNSIEKFDVIYDTGESKIGGVEGEISLNTPETFSWTGKLRIYDYEITSERYPWMKPDFQLLSNVRLSLSKKLVIDGSMILSGETEAKIYTFNPSPVETAAAVKSFLDLSGGAEYNFSNKIGLYLHVNNILGTPYQQYLYYSKLGLNVIGGLNISF